MYAQREPGTVTREVASGITGIVSVPLGVTVLALAVGAGLAVQLVAEDSLGRAKQPVAGVVDGGAAILARLAFA